MGGFGLLWMVLAGFWVVLGGFGWFACFIVNSRNDWMVHFFNASVFWPIIYFYWVLIK